MPQPVHSAQKSRAIMSVAAFFGFRGPDYYTRKLLQRVKESITAEEDEAMAKAQESVKSSMTKLRNWVYGEVSFYAVFTGKLEPHLDQARARLTSTSSRTHHAT